MNERIVRPAERSPELRTANDAAIGWMGGAVVAFGVVAVSGFVSMVAELVTWSWALIGAMVIGGLVGAYMKGYR